MIIQIDLTEPFEKSEKLFTGLMEIANVSDDHLAPAIHKKCEEITKLITELKPLLKAN